LFFIYPARHGVPSPAVQFFKCGDKKVVRWKGTFRGS
jgi:hypothetical protein